MNPLETRMKRKALVACALIACGATGDCTVTTDAVGVARFEVPLHAAFSLTTVPVS